LEKKTKNCFVGDVLFKGSIGRTDLPGGDFDTLIKSIKEKLFLLEDDIVAHPGHGPNTTLGVEKKTNPFLV
jgi:glyoxylase-like metal-dependent hydrolase (beta-lactamase superfamily II)